MKTVNFRRKLLLSSSTLLLSLILPARSSTPAFADSSVTGTGGTITVHSSGSSNSVVPGGIITTSTTTYTYYNGWPIQQTVPIYSVYTPLVVSGSSSYTNEPCLVMTTTSQTTSYSEAYQLEAVATQTWNSLNGLYPSCNPANSISSNSQKTPSPAQIVTTYWNTTIKNQLPTPRFTIPPGYALTGLPSFLVSTCELAETFTDRTPIGAATVNATGELWVKWNSGENWTGPYHSCGLPWPNGTISHVYEKQGSSTVSLKETWSASWRLGGGSGTLDGLITSPSPVSLSVHSITSEIYS